MFDEILNNCIFNIRSEFGFEKVPKDNNYQLMNEWMKMKIAVIHSNERHQTIVKPLLYQ